MTDSPKPPKPPSHKRGRRWMLHAIGAGSLALLAFLGGAASEFLSDDFKKKFAPYNKWVLALIIVAAVIEVVRAIVAARAQNNPPSPPTNITTADRNVSIGQSNSGTIISGDHNVVASGTQGDVVGRDKITHIHHTPAEPAPKHQLPPPPPDFTGRERELNELLDRLGQGVKIFGMHGLGGVGKTTLALKLAEHIQGRYPDAQIYLDLQGAGASPLSPAKAMEHVIRAYHPTARLPESLAELGAMYRSVLHGQRALLLLDNAYDRQQVEPLTPLPPDCLLLITSRKQFYVPGLRSYLINIPLPNEAQELLLTIAPHIVEHADEIAQLCGRLPLALRAAASLLAVTVDLHPSDYVQQLRDERTRLEKIGTEGVEIGVEASFNLSYMHLHPDGARVFRQLSIFLGSFDASAEEAICEDEGHKRLTEELVRLSLVNYDKGSDRYSLHDLVRLFADARLSEAECETAKRRHAIHYPSVLAQANDIYLAGEAGTVRGLAMFDLERANIEAGQQWAAAFAGADNEAAQLCIDYPTAGYLVLSLRQHPRDRINWLEIQLAAARRLRRRDSEGAALGNLGIAYRNLGEARKAIELNERHIAIAREIGDRRGESAALSNLGLAWADLGETRKAIEFYEQRIAIAREIGDRRGEGQTLGNLGIAYKNLGETRKAIAFYEQNLDIAREIGDRRGEANVLNNLGVAYKNFGETRKAIEFYEQSHIIAREIGDRRSEGNALNNLGVAWAALGEPRKAIEFYDQYLTIAREIGDRKGEGNALNNLGAVWADLGETRKAIAFYEQRLSIAREIGDSRGEGSAFINLGAAWADLSEPRKAIEFYEQALIIIREMGDRGREGTTLWEMSQSVDNLGDRTRAITLAEAALKICEAIESPTAEEVRKQLVEWHGRAEPE